MTLQFLLNVLSSGALGALIGYFGRRKVRRATAVALAASATADVAGAVEDIIKPLRDEVRILRAQVALLTKELRRNGLPVPDLSKA